MKAELFKDFKKAFVLSVAVQLALYVGKDQYKKWQERQELPKVAGQ